MKPLLLCLAAFAVSAPALSQTTVPPAPTLTAGPEFKGLQFDWEPAAGATSYELEYRANQTAAFVRLGNVLPASATTYRYRFPLHLFNWTYARYRLAACNATGCSRSPEVSVSALRRFAPGYFKAALSTTQFRFGIDADLSPDGLNFVASSQGDSDSGAVYVFRRNSDGSWAQRARLLPQNSEFNNGVGAFEVEISADGNTVVAALPTYSHSADDQLNTGEVFVFKFNGTSWVRTRLLSGIRGSFGRWISLSDAGDTLAVATGSIDRLVLIYRLTNGTWQPVRSIAQTGGISCSEGRLSGDGSTLAEPCVQDQGGPDVHNFVRVHTGANWTVRQQLPLQMDVPSGNEEGYCASELGIDTTGDTIAAQVCISNIPEPSFGPSQVNVFRRAAGVYSQVAVLKPGAWRSNVFQAYFGSEISVSGDGKTIAVADAGDDGLGTGVRAAPLTAGDVPSCAVYVFRQGVSNWILASVVKPSYRPPSDQNRLGFGLTAVELSTNGQTLMISDYGDTSDAQGIGGDWHDDDAQDSGAVWLY